jgi:hypothetical protein
MDHNDLCAACDAALIGNLPQGIRDAIDAGLAAGMTKQQMLDRYRFVASLQGHKPRSMMILAIEAYLGADQQGNLKP